MIAEVTPQAAPQITSPGKCAPKYIRLYDTNEHQKKINKVKYLYLDFKKKLVKKAMAKVLLACEETKP